VSRESCCEHSLSLALEEFIDAYSKLSAPAAVELDLTLRRSQTILYVVPLATWAELVAC
jgi:hypothetical protein